MTIGHFGAIDGSHRYRLRGVEPTAPAPSCGRAVALRRQSHGDST
jgi:hypothetical protein